MCPIPSRSREILNFYAAIRPDSSNNLRLMHLLFPRMISDPGSVILSRSHFVNGPLSLPEDGILSSGIKLCFDLLEDICNSDNSCQITSLRHFNGKG